ncbi:MAG: Uma2 family endonuclease [Gemmatimonadaceae bacterium]
MTAEELERLDIPGKVTELIRGRLIVREPPGTRHGMIAATLCFLVASFVRREKLGAVFAQDTGFKIESDPDTVRAPDVAFLSAARLGAVGRRGYAPVAPDLAAEVVSPDDRAGEVLGKVGSWLSAGSKLVWVVDPDREEVRVYRPDGSVRIVGSNDSIDGENVLPGFTCSVREILR